MDLGFAEGRRGRRRVAARGGGRRRGIAGEGRKVEALAVEMSDLERGPRQAIAL